MTAVSARPAVDRLTAWRHRLALGLVAVLPLHTVFVHRWIAWKPFLVLLLAVVALDVRDGFTRRRWPWEPRVSLAAGVFLAAVAVGFPIAGDPERFLRLLLALGVGVAIMLVVARVFEAPDGERRLLRTVYWSAAALAATGVLLSFVGVGTFGPEAIDRLDTLPLVHRLYKPAYLTQGFLAVTNWHQDPGYAAAWTNLWAAVTIVAAARGAGARRVWIDGAVIGGLGLATFMTMSRTGWLGFVVASVVGFGTVLVGGVGDRRRHLRVAAAAVLVWLGLVLVLGVVDPTGVGADLETEVAFRLSQNLTLDAGDAGALGNTDGVVDARSIWWPWYLDAFRSRPLLGIGLGTGWAAEGVQEPHNLLLELLGETGIVGFVGFVVLGATVLRRGGGLLGGVALAVALASAITQTVIFEGTLWFAAGLYVGGGTAANAFPVGDDPG
ncbi:MAG TPA: O-antigen ligase domain-containing protein [Actinobacteria bacterium]|nr:O-antigen ligase domain-containing protein [Actinomycetota bacterium]